MDLSVIIISYNTDKLLKGCIASIQKCTKNVNYELIIVDNGSTDDSVKIVRKLARDISNITLIRNRNNVGFGKANNQGIKKAKGKYILLLNSDTLVHNNVLGEMFAWMEQHENVGVTSCRLRNKDGSVQGTGGYFPTLLKVFTWLLFIDDIPFVDSIIKPFHPIHDRSPIFKGKSLYTKTRELDWVTGAFMLIRSNVLNKVGIFDEDYFMYTEEVDLCFRIKKAGWRIMYLPEWNITHLGGASSNKEYPIISEYKGIMTFYRKHIPSWQMPVLKLLLKVGAVLRMIIFGVLEGKSSYKAYVKAYQIV